MTEDIKNEQIKQLVTPEFLETLGEVAKLYGWSGDYVEISNFVESLYEIKNIKHISEEPYIIEG